MTCGDKRSAASARAHPNRRACTTSTGSHLASVQHHFPHVPLAILRKSLAVVLSFEEDWDRQIGLMALLPLLSGEDHRRAADALAQSVLRTGSFATTETRWDLLSDGAIAPLIARLKDDAYGWSRNELIAHVHATRSPELADQCLYPLVDALPELAADSCLEIITAMTPWLADRSGGEAPRALAAIAIPTPSVQANPLYVIDRVLKSTTSD
jgi:hypothetical protein